MINRLQGEHTVSSMWSRAHPAAGSANANLVKKKKTKKRKQQKERKKAGNPACNKELYTFRSM